MPALLTLVRIEHVATTEQGHNERISKLTVRDPLGGEAVLDVRGYEDIVARYNAALAATATAKRFVGIETNSDFYVYVFIDPAVAVNLATTNVIPFETEYG